jgi:hypothetical protein
MLAGRRKEGEVDSCDDGVGDGSCVVDEDEGKGIWSEPV